MFGWFAPTCPCDPAAKRWVEDSLRWLAAQFGLHILLERPVILPTAEYFPDPWDGSPKAGRLMFRRICEYMGADPKEVDVEFYDDYQPFSTPKLPGAGFAAGTWHAAEEPASGWPNDAAEGWGAGRVPKKGLVRLERVGLQRPADLAGIMAHELAHQRLLGEGRISPDQYDNELLTDLTATYHGFGVFLANNPRKSTGELRRWPGTQLYRPEYMSEPMFGYAMAHIAWFRDERSPDWGTALRLAPRAVFKQGLRYLFKMNDSTFRPVRLGVVGDENDGSQ